MSEKIEIEIELLRDLCDAAGYVSTFHTMFVNHETPDNCGDLNAAEYLASEAVLIEQRGRAVLEAVEHQMHPTAFGVCPHGVNLGNQACVVCEPEKFGVG